MKQKIPYIPLRQPVVDRVNRISIPFQQPVVDRVNCISNVPEAGIEFESQDAEESTDFETAQ